VIEPYGERTERVAAGIDESHYRARPFGERRHQTRLDERGLAGARDADYSNEPPPLIGNPAHELGRFVFTPKKIGASFGSNDRNPG